MRADALLTRYGYCTRREAQGFLRTGRVRKKDGTPVLSASLQINPTEVLIDGAEIPFLDGLYIALHKPVGYVCSHVEEDGAPTVFELLPESLLRRKPTVQTVGRLDKATSGLLLLSDDGKFVHHLTSPGHHVPKVYCFSTSAPVPPEATELFAAGKLMLKGESTPCLPAHLELQSPRSGRLTLEEGRYHQVRRMLAAVGAPVVQLHREAIGPIQLSSLVPAPGEWCGVEPSIFGYDRK